MALVALQPWLMCSQNRSRPTPNGDTTPMPLITTRRASPRVLALAAPRLGHMRVTIIERRGLTCRPAAVVLAGVCVGGRSDLRCLPQLLPVHVRVYLRGNPA